MDRGAWWAADYSPQGSKESDMTEATLHARASKANLGVNSPLTVTSQLPLQATQLQPQAICTPHWPCFGV